MSHENHELRLLREIARTQQQQGKLLLYIEAAVSREPVDDAKMAELTAELKASHDRLQAALDAVPPTTP